MDALWHMRLSKSVTHLGLRPNKSSLFDTVSTLAIRTLGGERRSFECGEFLASH